MFITKLFGVINVDNIFCKSCQISNSLSREKLELHSLWDGGLIHAGRSHPHWPPHLYDDHHALPPRRPPSSTLDSLSLIAHGSATTALSPRGHAMLSPRVSPLSSLPRHLVRGCLIPIPPPPLPPTLTCSTTLSKFNFIVYPS